MVMRQKGGLGQMIVKSFEVKESGNVTSGIYALFGKSFNQKDKKLFNVPFAQYVRLSAEYREEFRLSPRTSR